MTSAIKNFAEFSHVIQIYKIRSICNGRNSEILKPIFFGECYLSSLFCVHIVFLKTSIFQFNLKNESHKFGPNRFNVKSRG